jgi:CheY-like chemotaxis protein/anti-sigma regulatory factor (Ser/Thr protein kinase)
VLVCADATRLTQIVTNIVNNAVKFTDAGGSVRVRVREVDGRAELSVSDTGIGIARDQLRYIFDLFRQANPGATRAKGGLGLGMAIVKQLAEAHGGEVRIESPGIGRGTTVTVWLPSTVPDERDEPLRFSSRGDLADFRILVVDDETDTLELLRHLLESEGAVVEVAESAVAALAHLDRASFDVLVSDLGLPEQDGFALIREVRARGRSAAALPAIALTGYADRDSANLSRAAGFQVHIGKPVDARELVTAIARAAHRGPAR